MNKRSFKIVEKLLLNYSKHTNILLGLTNQFLLIVLINSSKMLGIMPMSSENYTFNAFLNSDFRQAKMKFCDLGYLLLCWTELKELKHRI